MMSTHCSDTPVAKRPRTGESNEGSAAKPPQPLRLPRNPRTILTWNANGLAPRAKSSSNLDDFRRLLKVTSSAARNGTASQTQSPPDLICIQEARLRRSVGGGGGHPDAKELKEVQPFLMIAERAGYEPLWSLADSRKAGTLTLFHRRILSWGDGADGSVKDYCAFTLDGALRLMLTSHGMQNDPDLKELIGSPCSSNIATAGNQTQNKQSSLMAFMKPTKGSSGSSVAPSKHDPEGRIQYLRFDSFDILHTYVPNNGTKKESHNRRRQFDESIRRFLGGREAILAKAGVNDRPVIWLGDLNVARTQFDGTHHQIKSGGEVYEYWTDESKCYSKYDKPKEPRESGDLGIPGFTPNERRRFEETLRRAKLVDVWRRLHPEGVADATLPYLGKHGGTAEANPWDRANYTWRGTTGRNQAIAKYQGKGQRIDYFLLSENALGRVESCDILGYGEMRNGYFCGSDHCPVVLAVKGGEEEIGNNNKIQADATEEKKKPAASVIDLT